MEPSVLLLPSTEGMANVVGEKVKATGWYGLPGGLHTIAIYTQNLKGRVIIEASLSVEPTESDWFVIQLNPGQNHIEYPKRPNAPTGINGGDSGVEGFTFRANVVWLRAKLDRSYMSDAMETEEQIGSLGIIRKIVLGL